MTDTNGAKFVVLHHFNDTDGTGDLGASPNSGLVFSGGILYGIGGGALYSLGTDGSNFTVLWSFGDFLDSLPAVSGLTVTNGTLYCAATQAGAYGFGQIFAMITNGTGFTDFHDFTPVASGGYPAPPPTNADGYFPQGGLVLLNKSLYGVATHGGTNSINYNTDSSGVIFRALPAPSFSSSQISGNNFLFNLPAFDGLSYTVKQSTNVEGPWIQYSNFTGNSTIKQFTVPTANPQLYFRVNQP
jgi:hypothetical protein